MFYFVDTYIRNNFSLGNLLGKCLFNFFPCFEGRGVPKIECAEPTMKQIYITFQRIETII